MRFIAFLLLILTLVHATTLFGNIYDADYFTKLNNTVVKVTGPTSTQIIANGEYSLELPAGQYELFAVHYSGRKVDYIIKEMVTIGEADTKFDLVLVPYELYLLTPRQNEDIINVSGGQEDLPVPEINGTILFIFGALIIIGVIIYILWKYARKAPQEMPKEQYEKEKAEETETMEYLPDKEAKEVLRIIKENEGRMYQKELREILNWSEAKMSITITELETAGLVKRFKKGRDNMLKLLK